MIRRIEALHYRCLRYISQELSDFQVLVGPNASGKTTFLDVIAFLGDLVTYDLEEAIAKRTNNFQDLLWNRKGDHFELAIEVEIPEELRVKSGQSGLPIVRYEVSIGYDKSGVPGIMSEMVLLKDRETSQAITRRTLFPEDREPPRSINNPIIAVKERGTKRHIVNQASDGIAFYFPEILEEQVDDHFPSFKLGTEHSSLRNLPADEHNYPVATWLKEVMKKGIQQFMLNGLLIRQACPPGFKRGFKPDGSNLPWVIEQLKKDSPEMYGRWVEHLQTALPDITGMRTVVREDDKHRYLMLKYGDGLEVPSWMISDGTLRLLALTVPAYLQNYSGVYLIEEPENGIHPRAVETVFQSLSSVYNSQILIATHSIVMLSMTKPEHILCFSKTDTGAADIVRGDMHPSLLYWKGETDLGDLFAGGVLG